MTHDAQTARISIQRVAPYLGMEARIRSEADPIHRGLYLFHVVVPAHTHDGLCYSFHHKHQFRSQSAASNFFRKVLAVGTIDPALWTRGFCWGESGNVAEAAAAKSELFPTAQYDDRDPSPHCIHETPPHRNSKRPTR